MTMQARVREMYQRQFGQPAAIVVRAPGRVNLIGDHTDYNDGFVLPMAIDRAAWLAIEARDDRAVRLYAADLDQWGDFSLDDLRSDQRRVAASPGSTGGWLDYIKGTAWALAEAGHRLRGFQGMLLGDVPIGAGLSSSAAVEVATATALLAVAGQQLPAVQLALVAQRAECDWVGTRCGIMDQLISAAGQEGHALLIDCRTLVCEGVPLPPDAVVFVLDTGTRRGLVGSAYNERRAQCEHAAREMQVPALRDADLALLAAHASTLPATVVMRARHVISENARVTAAAVAMRNRDAPVMGEQMNQSHASLRDDFEVSTPALDAIVVAARAQPGCHGARMTGAGFGGCAVALVHRDHADSFAAGVTAEYLRSIGLSAVVYRCRATTGASVVAADDKAEETIYARTQ